MGKILEKFLLNPSHLLVRLSLEHAVIYRKHGENVWRPLPGEAKGAKRKLLALIKEHGVILTPAAEERIDEIPERATFLRP